MEFWNSFNVYNDNNNLLIKEIKSVGGNVGGILKVLGEMLGEMLGEFDRFANISVPESV